MTDGREQQEDKGLLGREQAGACKLTEKGSAMPKLIEITDQLFKAEVLEAETPVLVDFWAEWCGPCKMMRPIVEELAEEYEGRLKVCSVDVDAQPQSTNEYGIRSIPTLLLFKGSKVADQITGAVPKKQLIKRVEALL